MMVRSSDRWRKIRLDIGSEVGKYLIKSIGPSGRFSHNRDKLSEVGNDTDIIHKSIEVTTENNF